MPASVSDRKTISKLLRAIASGQNAQEAKHDVILNRAAELIDEATPEEAVPKSSMLFDLFPWSRLVRNGWAIVGMNHYNMPGAGHTVEKFLFVAMTNVAGRCIKVEGEDHPRLWGRLEMMAQEEEQQA